MWLYHLVGFFCYCSILLHGFFSTLCRHKDMIPNQNSKIKKFHSGLIFVITGRFAQFKIQNSSMPTVISCRKLCFPRLPGLKTEACRLVVTALVPHRWNSYFYTASRFNPIPAKNHYP